MSVTSRAVAAGAVLLAAAIPVGALTVTVSTTSDKDFGLGISTGSVEPLAPTPSGSAADTKHACGADCAVDRSSTRMVPQKAVIEGESLAAASPHLVQTEPAITPPTTGLIPRNPIAEALLEPEAEEPLAASAESERDAAEPEPAAEPKRPRKSAPRRVRQAKKKGPPAGSLQMLFQGPGN